MSESFYDILGVNENATKDEIKKTYRTLQMKYHPDRNNQAQEAVNLTQKINEAYETLGDEQKREQYDMMRKNPNSFNRMNSCGPHNVDVPLDDILNMMFGGNPFGGVPFGGGQFGHGISPGAKIHFFNGGPINFQQALNKPVPIIKSLQINMEQVLNGTSVPLEIERWILENDKKVIEKETIYVVVPPGIDENEIIILRDRGNVISDNCKGDIKITIIIQNNTEFKRSGLDIILEKKISLKESLCGFSFEIKYLNGKGYILNNNKGTIVHPEYQKIYPGMGLKRGEHIGNMVIVFHVEFPEKLTEEQIAKLTDIL
jgi:molecular chaperone DnaJ/curved DNA-binding protein